MKRERGTLNKKSWKEVVGRAAANLFYERGYLETSMDDIAAAAKLSKGGIYHYFSNKNEILFFISSDCMDLILKDLEEELKKIEDNSLRIQYIISRHLGLYIKYMAEAKTLFFEKHLLSPKYLRIIAGKERKYLQILVNVLSEFFKGKLPRDTLNVIAFSLFGMCNNIYHWYNPRGRITPEELAEIIHILFYEGVKGYSKGMDKPASIRFGATQIGRWRTTPKYPVTRDPI